MKRILAAIILLIMLFSLCSCNRYYDKINSLNEEIEQLNRENKRLRELLKFFEQETESNTKDELTIDINDNKVSIFINGKDETSVINAQNLSLEESISKVCHSPKKINIVIHSSFSDKYYLKNDDTEIIIHIVNDNIAIKPTP